MWALFARKSTALCSRYSFRGAVLQDYINSRIVVSSPGFLGYFMANENKVFVPKNVCPLQNRFAALVSNKLTVLHTTKPSQNEVWQKGQKIVRSFLSFGR